MQVVCNPGIQARHWQRMSEVVGFDIMPTQETTLLTFLDFGLAEHLPKLEEIAASAAKEHKLEMTLKKMMADWSNMRFELLPYRDTVSLLKPSQRSKVVSKEYNLNKIR